MVVVVVVVVVVAGGGVVVVAGGGKLLSYSLARSPLRQPGSADKGHVCLTSMDLRFYNSWICRCVKPTFGNYHFFFGGICIRWRHPGCSQHYKGSNKSLTRKTLNEPLY